MQGFLERIGCRMRLGYPTRLFTLALCGACAAHVSKPPAPSASREYAAIDSTVQRIFALGVAPGMGVVVVRDSGVVYDRRIGAEGPVSTRLAYTGDYRDDHQFVELLRAHPPAAHGRAYQYSNIGYNVAALAMDAVTDECWRETLEKRVFRPLGMRHTSTYLSAFPRDQYATPYVMTATGFSRTRFAKFDNNMQSAGGIVSTTSDMGRWLIANINDGRIDGFPRSPWKAPFTQGSRRDDQVRVSA